MTTFMTLHLLRRALVVTTLAVTTFALAACSASDLVDGNPLPADQRDPNVVKNSDGALAAYRGALVALTTAIGNNNNSYVYNSGLLTDELESPAARRATTTFPTTADGAVDSRSTTENDLSQGGKSRESGYLVTYTALQKVRGSAQEARGALKKYAPTMPKALIGHLFAVEGISDVLLAELFCSGIPLSRLDFEADYTLEPGSSTEEVYRRALTLFDSALTFAADSTRIVRIAQLGRARALLGLGEYDSAAAAVADIPTDFTYSMTYTTAVTSSANFFLAPTGNWQPSVGDVEGGTGLPFVSSGDPRSATVQLSGSTHAYFPTKYPIDGTGPIVLSSGVEARLIEAEAALSHGEASWLDILNTLRTDGTYTVSGTDTTWNAGTGGVAGLKPLTDPGTDTARVTLLFTERAYWLFLTGHRQGDLRRLVRQYHRDQETVYPTGGWAIQQVAPYGTDVNLPIPLGEQQSNPYFHGCLNRDA
jgi:hypothetical protein